MDLPFDEYTIRARFFPAALVVIPVPLAAAAWLLVDKEVISVVEGLGGWFVLSLVFAQVGRDLGKRAEPDLWAAWGGPPTTQFLRHGTPYLPRPTRERYHAILSRLTGLHFPSADEQARDPAAADEVYRSATAFLIQATRGPQFPLVREELINYGQRRNIWGMRPAGIFLSCLGVAASVARASLEFVTSGRPSALSTSVAIACAALFAFWTRRFSSSWVRMTAEAYAARLVEATEALGSGDSRTPT